MHSIALGMDWRYVQRSPERQWVPRADLGHNKQASHLYKPRGGHSRLPRAAREDAVMVWYRRRLSTV